MNRDLVSLGQRRRVAARIVKGQSLQGRKQGDFLVPCLSCDGAGFHKSWCAGRQAELARHREAHLRAIKAVQEKRQMPNVPPPGWSSRFNGDGAA
jgi:hypothetical protein